MKCQIQLAALLLIYDLVNPYHERKDQKQKEKKKGRIMTKRYGGIGTDREWEEGAHKP